MIYLISIEIIYGLISIKTFTMLNYPYVFCTFIDNFIYLYIILYISFFIYRIF